MTMRRLVALAVPVLALLAAAPALAGVPSVKTAKKEGIGTYLTDARGMTLYTFKNDMPGMSHCDGPCLEKWPAFYEARVEPVPGIKGSDFGTLSRADGRKQTTYKGMPLYYFAGDKAGGDTEGQGFRSVWYAAAP